MTENKIILTTPDFPPKLGGLSSFSRNLYELFKRMGFDVEVLEWSTASLLSTNDKIIKPSNLYVHVHFLGGFLGNFPPEKSINFCHGSELLFTSANPIKKILKRIAKNKAIHYMEKSLCNFFISEFTKNKLNTFGLTTDYSRDFVVHNGIVLDDHHELISKEHFINNKTIKLCSIARDVPHKNFDGVLSFCRKLHEVSNLNIELYLTSDRFKSEVGITVTPLLGKTDKELIDVYKISHLNILLSKDHSNRGFFEGFGLTVLEAAQWGTPSVVACTGGLPENVHHLFNGYILRNLERNSVADFYKEAVNNYGDWSKNSYHHVVNGHSMDIYKKIFNRLLESSYE